MRTILMGFSDKGLDLLYRLGLCTSFICISFLLNPDNIVIRCAIILLGVVSLFVKKRFVTLKDLTFIHIVSALFPLVIAAFTGSIHKGYTHLAISLILTIPSLFAVINIAKTAKEFISRPASSAGGKPLPKGTRGVTLKEYVVIFLSAAGIMTVASTSSPLYPFNYWDDANVFLTMGRGIIHSLVPYRDIYEQKGPVLFFIHAVCALISEDSFIGVYFLEIAESFIFLLFTWKTVRLFAGLPSGSNAVFILPLLSSVIYTAGMFYLGDSAEEMAFSIIPVILYLTLKALLEDKTIPTLKEVFVIGLLTGILFWVKYTLCAFVGGFVIFFIIYCIIIRRVRDLFLSVASFIGGFVTITVPVMIYFVINNSLGDLFTAYFYNNIFLYNTASTPKEGFESTIIFSVFANIGLDFKTDIPLLLMILLSISLIPVFNKRTSAFLLICLFTTVAGAFGNNYIIFYYGLILVVFTPLLFIPAASFVQFLFEKGGKKSRLIPYAASAVLVVGTAFSVLNTNNIIMLGGAKEDLPQYKFGEVIKETPDAKILTYDVMDLGFYTMSGTLPSNKYFCFLNIRDNLPDILEEQDGLIEESYFDYIITYSDEYEWDSYEIVMEATYPKPEWTDGYFTDELFLYKRVR